MVGELDEEFDDFEQIDLEEKFQLYVGHVYYRVYMREREFKEKLAHLVNLIGKKQRRFETFDAAGAVNMFIGQAFRQSQLASETFDYAQEAVKDFRLHDLLMLVHHDLVDGIIMPLHICRKYLISKLVLESLGLQKSSVDEVFNKSFGEELVNARDLLAHEEERMFPAPESVQSGDLLKQVADIQHRGSDGRRLIGLRNREREVFNFGYEQHRFYKLVEDLSKLFRSSQAPAS